MDRLELAREVYRLLIEHSLGFTVPQLASRLECDERQARDAVSLCRKLAASHAHTELGLVVLGYDPERERYVVAKNAAQAERIMLHLHSRVADMVGALELMSGAYVSHYGRKAPQAVQKTIFQSATYKENLGLE